MVHILYICIKYKYKNSPTRVGELTITYNFFESIKEKNIHAHK